MVIQNTDSFVPYSYNDLLKIIYTTINYGWDSFTFYCPSEYEKCINDVENISKDEANEIKAKLEEAGATVEVK